MWAARRASVAAAAHAALPAPARSVAHNHARRVHVQTAAAAAAAVAAVRTPRPHHARCPLSAPPRRPLSTGASDPASAPTAAGVPPTPDASSAAATASPSGVTPSFDPSRLSGLLRELYDRGMIADLTQPDAFLPHLSPGGPSRTVYAGFDPTASSLHIGNLLVLMVLRRFQQWGHRPVCVVGGATGAVGDPSGRSSERNLLDEQQLQRNIEGITSDIRKFLVFESDHDSAAHPSAFSTSPSAAPSPAPTPSSLVPPPFLPSIPPHARSLLLNNSDWFSPLRVVPFLRDVGRHFRMGTMLAKESVSARLNSAGGMSFTEFAYQMLQAYDFAHLYRRHGVSIQIGGSDQWGNITAGIDLIQRQAAHEQQQQQRQQSSVTTTGTTAAATTAATATAGGPQVFGLTLPLLTTSDGHKFGKSMGNAPIWLSAPNDSADPASAASSSCTSSPYELYQYFLTRTADRDALRFLRLFTDHSLADIERMGVVYRDEPQKLCTILAESVTRMVHGDAGLVAAQAATRALFGGQLAALSWGDFMRVFDGVPSRRLARSALLARSVVELAVEVGACKSKAEARRLVAQGGLYLNNTKVESDARRLQPEDLILDQRVCVLRSGKKKQFVLMVADDDGESANTGASART